MKIRGGGELGLSAETPASGEPQIGLGRAIRSLREDRGMCCRTLAERAEIDVELLEAIESGTGDVARWNTVAWIARAADASLREVGALAEHLAEDGDEGVKPDTTQRRRK